MSHAFTYAKVRLAKGEADLEALDIRAVLCMTNTTADTERDAQNMVNITTLDRCTGAGYGDATLTTVTVAADTGLDLAKVTCDAFTFGSVAAAVRQMQGILVYVRVDGTDANDWPLAWIDSGAAYPFSADGSAINVTPNAAGMFRIS